MTPNPKREIAAFVALGAALSVPFLAISGRDEMQRLLRLPLPGSALMVVVPGTTAWILSRREFARGQLLAQLHVAGNWQWRDAVAIATLPCGVMLDQMQAGRAPVERIPPTQLLTATALFLVGAIGEEVGWAGYVTPRFRQWTSPVGTGLGVGAIWAGWHLQPWASMGRDPAWIAGQAASTIAFRWLLVEAGEGTAAPVRQAVLAHAAYNLAYALTPQSGRFYRPWLVTAITVSVTTLLAIRRRKGLR